MTTENAALTIEGAMGLLIEKNNAAAAGAENKAENSANSAENTEQPDEGDNAAQSATADEGEQNTAVSDDRQETTEESGEQGDALPPIEAPSSWKAEDKTAFSKLPRDAQEVIHRREQERDTELRSLQNKSAEQHKSADAEVVRLKALNEQLQKHIVSEVDRLAGEFPEIKSEADLVKLAQSDPARFSVFQARLQQFQTAQAIQQKAQQELQTKAADTEKTNLAAAKEALVKAFPKWKDPEVARKEITELQDYAIKSGATEQAARSTLDPVIYQLAQKAMFWDKAQKAKAEALKNNPPRVVKPGASNTGSKADDKASRRQAQLGKLSKSGDIEDARGLLRQ